MNDQIPLFKGSPGPPKRTSGLRVCPACQKEFRPYNTAEGYQAYCSEPCRHKARDTWLDYQDITRDSLGRLPAEAERDKALEDVKREVFAAAGIALIQSLPSGEEVTGEEIRLRCEARGIEPHHHNAWGALVMFAVRKGLLSNTGRYVPMTTQRSHARRTPVYVVL